jgi:hypothetical protein
VTGERSDEPQHLPAALEPAEAAFGVERPGGTPAFDHLAVAPPLHDWIEPSTALSVDRPSGCNAAQSFTSPGKAIPENA